MSHSPSLFANCVALNNQGVRKFVKEQNLEEACLLFGRALSVVKKQWTELLQFSHNSDSANASSQCRLGSKRARSPLAQTVKPESENASSQYRKGSKRAPGTLSQAVKPESENIETTQQDTELVIDEGYLAQVGGQQHHCQEEGSENGRKGSSRRKRWNATVRASPVRLGTNYTARNAPDPLQWRLATTVVAFNLALTYHLLGNTSASPQEAPKRWKAAFALFELACSLRIAVVTKKSFKGDMLAALDTLIVQNTLNLHRQMNSTPSRNSNFRKLESYVKLIQSSVNNKK